MALTIMRIARFVERVPGSGDFQPLLLTSRRLKGIAAVLHRHQIVGIAVDQQPRLRHRFRRG